jgi:hypothetical protein
MEMRGRKTKTVIVTVTHIAANIRVTLTRQTRSAHAHQMNTAVTVRPGEKIRASVRATRKKNVAL